METLLAGISIFILFSLFGYILGSEVGLIGFGFLGLFIGGIIWAGSESVGEVKKWKR